MFLSLERLGIMRSGKRNTNGANDTWLHWIVEVH